MARKTDRDGLVLLCIAIILSACFALYVLNPDKKSDNYIRDRVLQLKGPRGACTGVQIKAPSGMIYTLTAGHCREILAEDSSALAIDEQGNSKIIYMLDIDEEKDLMLMSATSYKSIDIAKKTYPHEHVHTLTHGLLHVTHRTDGELLEMQDLMVPVSLIASDSDAKACNSKPSHKAMDIQFGLSVCAKIFHEMMTTAVVYPGSSGGPALNDDGKLIGIASISESGTIYSGIVPLDQIQDFMANR